MIPTIKIKKRLISKNHHPLVIVELGINHLGKAKLAKKIILSAKKAGAEIIKMQTHIPEKEMSLEAKKIYPPNAKTSIYNVIKNNSINSNDEKKLKIFTEKNNLIFVSTPFSREAAKRLNDINVPAFKIGSGECNNYPLIEYICKFKKPIILSTGMNDIKSIRKSVKIIEKYKIPYAIMHCTNLYPTKPSEVRLNCLIEIEKEFPNAVIGLSDHTSSNYTSFAAVAMGASIIEKHYVDDKRKYKGPDISSSIDFKDLKDLINGARIIHESKKGIKKILPKEKAVAKFAFASIVSIKKIEKGEKLSLKNIWVKRPGTGDFKASELKKILGKKAKKMIPENVQIRKSYI